MPASDSGDRSPRAPTHNWQTVIELGSPSEDDGSDKGLHPAAHNFQTTIGLLGSSSEDDNDDQVPHRQHNWQPVIELGSSSEDEVDDDHALRHLSSRQAPIELGSSSEDDSSEDGNYNDGKYDTRMSVTDPGDHTSHRRQTPIELGSSSDADDEEENDNDNDRRNDTSMDASDPSMNSRHTHPEQAPTLLRQPSEDEDHEEDHEHDERNDRHHNTKMASSNLDEDAPRQATSESPLLFELPNEEDGKVNDNDNDGDDSRMSAPSPPLSEAPTNSRNETEAQIERNERRDEVEPGLTEFRKERDLHVRQLKDLNKKALMVSNRIDKLNDDVEKLRQQWGTMEREKAALLTSSERYEQRTIKQEMVVHRDDVKAKKYHDYLTLVEDVLILEDEEDEEEEERPVFDWGTFGHVGTAETEGEK